MTTLTSGKQWIAHCGKGARLRYLKQRCNPIIRSKDPQIQSALARVRQSLEQHPEKDFGLLWVVSKALSIIDDTGVGADFALNYLMDQWDADQTLKVKLPVAKGAA